MTTASPSKRDLLVVMPVYNEEAAVEKVVTEWLQELACASRDFLVLVINDGSKDGTMQVLDRLQAASGGAVQVIHRENRGHGQTCLQGYRYAIEHGFNYVMQIDSDWQCDPRFFSQLWAQRSEFDVIYGQRMSRDDGWRRVLASWVLKMTVWLRSGALCTDPNVPYRLMRVEVLLRAVVRIPPDFFLANVALAVLLRRDKSVRHGRVPIHFRDRFGGQPLVPLGQFWFRARQLMHQLGKLDSNSSRSQEGNAPNQSGGTDAPATGEFVDADKGTRRKICT